MSALVLRGGRVIDPAAGIDGAFDVMIRAGRIAAVERAGSFAAAPDAQVVDAVGWWVMPGFIDPHAHLRDPGFPAKETILSGLRAAAAGGFTAVAAMANTMPVNDCPEVARYMRRRAEKVRAARLIPVSAVTRGLKGAELVDMASMAEAGARLFSDDGVPIDDALILSRAFDEANRLGFAISLHEEDRSISGAGAVNAGETARRLGVGEILSEAEISRVRRDLALALGSGAAVHIAHASTAATLDLVRAARKNGAAVTCEATPHHLVLDDSAAADWGPNAKMAPPLRARADVEALRAGLADGTVDMIATDHAPHDPGSKRLEQLAGCFPQGCGGPPLSPAEAESFAQAANGIVGLETAVGLAMELVHQGVIAPKRLVELMSLHPARLLGLEAGSLNSGVAADVTIIDPNRLWTVEPGKFLSKSRNTPFAGRQLKGRAMLTIVGGEIVYDARAGAPAGAVR